MNSAPISKRASAIAAATGYAALQMSIFDAIEAYADTSTSQDSVDNVLSLLDKFDRAEGNIATDESARINEDALFDRLLVSANGKSLHIESSPEIPQTKPRRGRKPKSVIPEVSPDDELDEDKAYAGDAGGDEHGFDSTDDHLAAETFEDNESNSLDPEGEGSEKLLRPTKKSEYSTKGASSSTIYLSALRGSRFDPISLEREQELGNVMMNGSGAELMAARDELVQRNMRFMIMMARRFIKTGRPFDDLCQAGSEGLLTAAMKFDPSKGRFTTFSAWWIRMKIQRSVSQDASIKMPAYLPGFEAKLRRMAAESGTDAERDHLEMRADKAAASFESRRRMTVSLDASVGNEDGDASVMDMMEAEGPSNEERVDQMRLVKKLLELANNLGDTRATQIFLMRSGMHQDNLGEVLSLDVIAKQFNLSKERVRQIYNTSAQEIATAMEYWAKGADNLPSGFRKNLVGNPKL